MLVAIDVGNTETKLGYFAKNGDLTRMWRVSTESQRTPDEYGVFFAQFFAAEPVDLQSVDAVAIASVVPHLDATLDYACRRVFGVEPIFLKGDQQRLIDIRTEHPAEVGADLIAAAIGAHARYGGPLIIASYGTATVFTAISAAGEFLGVAIAPGINISIDALVGRTAKLPQIGFVAPKNAIGRSTVEALQAGIVFGFVGQTQALVSRMRSELGSEARVIGTGGLADAVARYCPIIDQVDPEISMQGLRLFRESLRVV